MNWKTTLMLGAIGALALLLAVGAGRQPLRHPLRLSKLRQ